jgi:hypothetical protein
LSLILWPRGARSCRNTRNCRDSGPGILNRDLKGPCVWGLARILASKGGSCLKANWCRPVIGNALYYPDAAASVRLNYPSNGLTILLSTSFFYA